MASKEIDLDLEALRHHAWETTVPADGDYEAAARARIDWLEQSTPDDWHRFALGFNWDDPLDPLDWIVRQEQCDMATALAIFWRSEPGWDLMLLARGETPHQREEADIIAYVADRIAENGYTRRKIAWDAEPRMLSDYEEMKSDLAKIENPPWAVSRAMIRSLRGSEVVDSADNWAERPEGVRTGFWLDLPPSDIVTPHMELAEDKLHDALFESFVTGSGLSLLLAVGMKPDGQTVYLVALLGIIGWWVFSFMRNTSLVRGLVRAEGNPVPQTQAAAVFGSLCLFGFVTFELCSNLFAPDGLGALPMREKIVHSVLLGIGYVGIWFGLMKAAQFISRRFLFR